MIALDTNVLVRLVVEDDEAQTRVAQHLVTRARRAGESLYISDVVLCEFVWVLRARYRLPRTEIADALDAILRTELISTDSAGIIDRATQSYRDGAGDFADYVIRERAVEAGASEVVTFDRVLKREDGFRLIGA